ncbi:MAG: acyl carrier protein [bacterium]
MREHVLEIVRGAVAGLNEELKYPELENVSEATGLHGDDTGIDSLSLVSLIVDIETEVGSRFGREVVLADEKAMSRRGSPYRTVGALVDFIMEQLDAAGD